ncbi:MAG: V-type ATP synthase subunit F [Synergistaceae bacterium]|jgi:V/A-type H+-transporting ATPase subunit F|nr:V-type ATP synthase subunit F [Synergistaceae bacterium]
MAISGKKASMAAMGDYDSVLPFRAIGMETVVISAENRDSVPRMISRLAREGYAILFLEESLFESFASDAEGVNETERLSVIPIPGQSGSLGVGAASIRRSAERAVGMDIFNVG